MIDSMQAFFGLLIPLGPSVQAYFSYHDSRAENDFEETQVNARLGLKYCRILIKKK